MRKTTPAFGYDSPQLLIGLLGRAVEQDEILDAWELGQWRAECIAATLRTWPTNSDDASVIDLGRPTRLEPAGSKQFVRIANTRIVWHHTPASLGVAVQDDNRLSALRGWFPVLCLLAMC